MLLPTEKIYNKPLNRLPSGKLLISTLNAHCYNMAKTDLLYKIALLNSDVIIPDGIGIVWAFKLLTGKKIKKIAGADLFYYEMNRLQQIGGKCFFLGSYDTTLNKIKIRVTRDYPHIIVQTYSPPYKTEFSSEDNSSMLAAINTFKPDVLLVGMTAPKQEKWAYQNYNRLQAEHICCIGAVFDFYAGTINRAPQWIIEIGMEWLYRMIKEPRRMWRRYLAGNIVFILHIIREKLKAKQLLFSKL